MSKEQVFDAKFTRGLKNQADKIESRGPTHVANATALRVTADLLKNLTKRQAVELLQSLLGGDPTTIGLEGTVEDDRYNVWGLQTVCNGAAKREEIAETMYRNLAERLRKGEDLNDLF